MGNLYYNIKKREYQGPIKPASRYKPPYTTGNKKNVDIIIRYNSKFGKREN
jgi:hypothetical protein